MDRSGVSRARSVLAWLGAVLVALMLLAAQSHAQTATGTLSNIDVRGNERIEDATILSYAGLTPGEAVSAGQINAAFQRLVGSGLFENVDVDIQGGTLIIEVEEFPTINQITVEGNRRINDEILLDLVTSQPRRVFSPTQVEADARTLTDAYRQAGRFEAMVTPKIIPRDQNRVDIVFEVTESRIVEVERIGFVGNRSYSDRRLRQVLETKQAGLFRTFIRSDQFIEDRVQFDQQVLTDFYRSRGYVDFRILSVTSEFSRERNAFFITFNIQEGQQYRFGQISTSSEIPGVSPEPFANVVRLRSGQVYSPIRIEDSIARIERKAIQDRIEFVRVDPRVTRNTSNLTLDVDFVLTRGPRIFVERIDIEGNTTTLDSVIRAQFDTVEGDPFNPREIRESAERIRALGYFTNADVDTREGTSPDRVIVDVNVEEQPTGSLTFGVNYSLEDGIGFAAGLSERNFLGRGQIFNLQIGIGVDNTNTSFGFTDPNLLGRDLAGGFDVYYRTTNNFSQDFNTTRLGFQPNLRFPVSDNGRLELRYLLERNEISDVDEDSSAILQREEGEELVSALGYTYTFDTTRTGLDPNTGIRFEFGQDFAGVGGDAEFIKTVAALGGETKVFNEEIGLTARLSGGALNQLSGDSNFLDRFRAGGNIRGFTRNGIGPRDLTAPNEDALGGNYFVALRTEMDFPLGLPEEYGIRGGLFFDTGSIWGLDDTAGSEGPVDDDFQLRAVVGFALYWDTPIGPLRFDFTRAVLKESFDETQPFDLSISTRF